MIRRSTSTTGSINNKLSFDGSRNPSEDNDLEDQNLDDDRSVDASDGEDDDGNVSASSSISSVSSSLSLSSVKNQHHRAGSRIRTKTKSKTKTKTKNKSKTKAKSKTKHNHHKNTLVIKFINMWSNISGYMNSTRLVVLLVLCLQNSLFTVLRRYSQGVLKENYSKHELLLVAEVIKILYSVWMISKNLDSLLSSSSSSSSKETGSNNNNYHPKKPLSLSKQLIYLVKTSRKMFVLALIYGCMNILSFVSLRNISAGMFTIFAQCKILTTATFSTIILRRQYSWTKWRALIALMLGVLLFSEPIWGDPNNRSLSSGSDDANVLLGTVAVLIEVSLSGFASIYFEKVIKTDPLQLGIWERNFQLALGSVPVYVLFIFGDGGGPAGFFGGWSPLAFFLSMLGAAGGLLVALSIKYGDSILKTLATTGAIVLTGVLDHFLLGGPLTPAMIIAAFQVIIAICNYTFDGTPTTPNTGTATTASTHIENKNDGTTAGNSRNNKDGNQSYGDDVDDENNKETEKLLQRAT